jgi:4-carboxymuconolactone decarboxylase
MSRATSESGPSARRRATASPIPDAVPVTITAASSVLFSSDVGLVENLGIGLGLAAESGVSVADRRGGPADLIGAKAMLDDHPADHTEVARFVERSAGIELRRSARTAGPSSDHALPRRTMKVSVDDPQSYIDDMARTRGYVLDYHKLMAKQDFPVLKATNDLVSRAYLDQRTLDRRTKELIFLVTLTVMRASKGHIQSHIQVALDLGVSTGEILEAIEIALPQAGIVAFQGGGRGLG